jgi:hypothetical protein
MSVTGIRRRIYRLDAKSCALFRLLIIPKMDEATAAPLSALLNWSSEMEK